MQTVAELTLPHLPSRIPSSPWTHAVHRGGASPASVARPMRASDTSSTNIRRSGISSYMDDKLRPSMDTITEIMGAKGTPWGEFMDNLMLAKTGAEHARLRSSVEASFTPKNINRYRALMQAASVAIAG